MDDAFITSNPGAASELQRLVDALFVEARSITQMELLLRAESFDLDEDAQEVVGLLPPGRYSRARLCDQLNSIITAHGWGMTVGTVS
jgi:hypothetical protein